MGGIRLGSIFGLEIRIDYSWFIIFFLILWTFTMGVFPAAAPGLAVGTYIAMGVAGTLLFFASLLAHELSHSLMARMKGIPVEGITLFIFGGMAHTRMEFEDPGDELVIAGVGPVSSFAIALLFGIAAWAGSGAGWSIAVTAVAQYLAFINLALAIFNLLPGFPLDGGRLFRAGVWKATGDLTKATRWAAASGKGLGYLLMGLGLLQIFVANLLGGLWLIFIGWFVRTAAESSYLQHLLRRSLEGVKVGEMMTPDPVTVAPETPLSDFVENYVFRGRHQDYPVAEDGRPMGIITLQRVKETPRDEWPNRTVEEAMLPASDGIVATPDESMAEVMERLEESKVRRILVLEEGRITGIITRSDLARWLERVQLLERR